MELSLRQMSCSEASGLDALQTERELIAGRLGAAGQVAAGQLQDALQDWRSPSRYERLGCDFPKVSESLRNALPPNVFADVNRLAVLELACRLPDIVPTRNLPDEVLALYP